MSVDDADARPSAEDLFPQREERRVQTVTCGRCGWPSACVIQEGMRVLQFVCHWCGKVTRGVVDPTIKNTIIF